MIKDARSDAVLSATLAGERIEAGFSGTLHGHSIPAMLRQPPPADSGTAQGELRVTIDRTRPQDSTAEGKLRVEALDLSWLAGGRRSSSAPRSPPIPRGCAFGRALQRGGPGVRAARGGAANRAGPVIEAGVESPAWCSSGCCRRATRRRRRGTKRSSGRCRSAGASRCAPPSCKARAHRVEPFDWVLSLEPRRARLEVKQARVCGVSFPLEFEARPETFRRRRPALSMRDEPLERGDAPPDRRHHRGHRQRRAARRAENEGAHPAGADAHPHRHRAG